MLALLLLRTAAATMAPAVVDRVDWPSFLARHDLSWHWTWGQGATYTLQPRSADISRCGPGGANGSCCVQTNGSASAAVVLAACDPTAQAQQWQLLQSGQYRSVHDGRCLQDKARAMLGACAASGSDPALAAQTWRSIDGYLYVPSTGNCLQVLTPRAFCTGTVCPKDRATPFSPGMALGTSPANNGDRSQLFAAYTLPTAASKASENLIPLTWTTSAYAATSTSL